MGYENPTYIKYEDPDKKILVDLVEKTAKSLSGEKPENISTPSLSQDRKTFIPETKLEDSTIIKSFFTDFMEAFNYIFHGTVNSKRTEIYLQPLAIKMAELLNYNIVQDYLRTKPEELGILWKKCLLVKLY